MLVWGALQLTELFPRVKDYIGGEPKMHSILNTFTDFGHRCVLHLLWYKCMESVKQG